MKYKNHEIVQRYVVLYNGEPQVAVEHLPDAIRLIDEVMDQALMDVNDALYEMCQCRCEQYDDQDLQFS